MKITTKQIINYINDNRDTTPDSIKEKRDLYWKSHDLDMNIREDIIFICTWQDSLNNLARVLKVVFKKLNCFEDKQFSFHYGARRNERIRKGTKDFYVLSSDNLLFRETFYSTLKELKSNK